MSLSAQTQKPIEKGKVDNSKKERSWSTKVDQRKCSIVCTFQKDLTISFVCSSPCTAVNMRLNNIFQAGTTDGRSKSTKEVLRGLAKLLTQ